MRRAVPAHALSAVAVVLVAVGCAGNPAPGDAGYPYNLAGLYAATFDVEGDVYVGHAQLATGPGGAVSGTFEVGEPAQVTGDISGSLVADTLRFDLVYLVIEQGCGGTARGEGPVAEGGVGAGGWFEVVDDCGDGEVLKGSFRFESALSPEGDR